MCKSPFTAGHDMPPNIKSLEKMPIEKSYNMIRQMNFVKTSHLSRWSNV